MNLGYVLGVHAPGRTDAVDGPIAAHHLLVAHALAAEGVRAISDAEVSVTLNFAPTVQTTDRPETEAELRHAIQNQWYVEPLSGRGYPPELAEQMQWDQGEVLDGDLALVSEPVDVLGVSCDEGLPSSLGPTLQWLDEHYSFPSYLVVGSGLATTDEATNKGRIADFDRIEHVHTQLIGLHAAIKRGSTVEGYLVRSLLDGFEWNEGSTSSSRRLTHHRGARLPFPAGC